MSLKRKWLKKYTKLEYLPDLLKQKHLFLGSPDDWDDKNDSELVKMHPASQNGYSIRGTCLTSAADRFHFWDIFGEREKGVCLWFDRELLIEDISGDASLTAKDVRYPSLKKLKTYSRSDLPFTKREQYHDEAEFRVLRVQATQSGAAEHFTFSPNSLRRIYVNSWIPDASVDSAKANIKGLLSHDLSHVDVKQSRLLEKRAWIEAARHIASG